MASSCIRSVSGASRSCLRSYLKQCVLSGTRRGSAPVGSTAETTQFCSSRARTQPSIAPTRFSSSSRCPSELGCCSGFLHPLHSAVALVRLNSSLSSTCRCYRALSQDGTDGT